LVFIAVGTQWLPSIAVCAYDPPESTFVYEHWLGDSDDQQPDLTEFGGLWSRMPTTTTAFVVGAAGSNRVLPLGGFGLYN